MYVSYYFRNNSNNPCTIPIIPPNKAPKYVIIFSSFFVMDRTKSSSLSVENVDTSCWTISAKWRLFSILATFSAPHFKPFVTVLGTTFSIIVSRTGSHTCCTDWFKNLLTVSSTLTADNMEFTIISFSTNVSNSFTSFPFNFSHSFCSTSVKSCFVPSCPKNLMTSGCTRSTTLTFPKNIPTKLSSVALEAKKSSIIFERRAFPSSLSKN
ncbi:hypothetical protein protein [Bacillus cereus G9241]|nr:hypothetical protein protein [Bacillus cereus G9241]